MSTNSRELLTMIVHLELLLPPSFGRYPPTHSAAVFHITQTKLKVGTNPTRTSLFIIRLYAPIAA